MTIRIRIISILSVLETIIFIVTNSVATSKINYKLLQEEKQKSELYKDYNYFRHLRRLNSNYSIENINDGLRKLEKTYEDEVPITYSNDVFYMEIHLGTPLQTLKVLLDTGSSFSYIHSNKCKEINDTHENSIKFDESKSESFSNVLNTTLDIFKQKKLKGIEGRLSSDIFKIGSLIPSPNNYEFGLITSLDPSLVNLNNLTLDDNSMYNSAVLGLGFNAFSSENMVKDRANDRDLNLLDYMKNNKIIYRRIFSFYNLDSYKETGLLVSVSQNESKLSNKWRFYIGDYPPEVEANPHLLSSCYITKEIDEIKEDEFKNKWLCDLTHGLLGHQINFNNTFEIDGYAAFYSGYKYILAPKRFLIIYKLKLISKLEDCK